MSSSAAAAGLHGPPFPRRLRVGDAPAQGADDADSTSSRLAELGYLQLQGAFDSAGIDDFSDPRVDLFLVDRHTPPQRLRHLLAAAWDIDPLTTLKLACHLRGKGFFAAAVWTWMHHNHPRTLAGNLSAFAELGFLKDFPELLHRLVQDADTEEAKATITRKRARTDDDYDDPKPAEAAELGRQNAEATTSNSPHLAEVALNMRQNDAAYSFLFDSVAEFFATNLRDNLNNPSGGIGLAAKWWCPLPDSPFDHTLLHDAIACLFFPSDSDHADEHQRRQYVDSARHRLHQQVLLLPLKSIPEKSMMTRSVPMAAARWPLPHKLVQHFGREIDQVRRNHRAVQQWRAMLDDMRSKGSLTNCLAVCDVSISDQRPRKVCVALGLLISQLSAEPWKDWVHAFNEDSAAHLLLGRYEDRVEYIRKMGCDDKFSLRKVFDWVLFVAKAASENNRRIEPLKTIFVFSQRDFDEALVPACKIKRPQDFDPAAPRPWKDEYDFICDKFKESDFEVPQVVFWNLTGQRSPALTFTGDGVMRLSGYSDDLMMLFLDKGGVVECEDEMYSAIAGEEYQKLEVHD